MNDEIENASGDSVTSKEVGGQNKTATEDLVWQLEHLLGLLGKVNDEESK